MESYLRELIELANTLNPELLPSEIAPLARRLVGYSAFVQARGLLPLDACIPNEPELVLAGALGILVDSGDPGDLEEMIFMEFAAAEIDSLKAMKLLVIFLAVKDIGAGLETNQVQGRLEHLLKGRISCAPTLADHKLIEHYYGLGMDRSENTDPIVDFSQEEIDRLLRGTPPNQAGQP